MGFLSEMRLILQIGAHFRRREPTARRKVPGSGGGIIGDARMDSVVKLEVGMKRLVTGRCGGAADKVKEDTCDETIGCTTKIGGGERGALGTHWNRAG